jgi:hypothetical protein
MHILEGDAREVVQHYGKYGICRGSYGQVLNNAKSLLSRVPSWRVQHVRRTANSTAHRLARMAMVSGENRVWREEYPLSVSETVSVFVHVVMFSLMKFRVPFQKKKKKKKLELELHFSIIYLMIKYSVL